jgi:hypothetical protein
VFSGVGASVRPCLLLAGLLVVGEFPATSSPFFTH